MKRSQLKKSFGVCVLVIAANALFPSIGFGGAGIYDPFAFVSIDNGPLNFYDLGAVTANPDFQGANFGTLNPLVDSLRIGGQEKSFKNSGSDVTGHTLEWRITELGGGFTGVAMPFQWNFGDGGAPAGLNNPGDQQWGGDTQGANGNPVEISGNVLTGLAPGTYHLEVFTFISTNGVNAGNPIFNNNGGANFKAIFNTPEPSSAVLVGIGLVGAGIRRRRR